MTTKMQQRRGPASEWTSVNTVLAAGEIGFETDTTKFKIGDGGTRWNDLPYFVNTNDIESGLLDTDEISEGTTNLYFTDQRAIDAVVDNIGLNDINDVNITDPADGEVLVYSDGDWVNQEASGGGIKDITFTTTSRALTLDDINDLVLVDSASEVSITIPANSTVSIPVKSQINIVQAGDSTVEIVSEQEVVGTVDGNLDPALSAATWTTQTSNFGNTNILSITYGENLWVAGGYSGQLRSSTNAVTWVTQTSNFGNSNITSIAHGDNLWVAVSAGSSNNQIRNSTDAITWVTQFSNFGNNVVNAVAYDNNLWVAGGALGQLRTSTDTINWVTQTSNFGSTIINSIAYGDNLWVAVGRAGQLRASTDAITWVTRTSNFLTNNSGHILSVAHGNNLWVAGGLLGALRTSTDTINWVTQTSNFDSFGEETSINSIAYGDNLWVAGGGSQIRTSTNAITWVTRTSNFESSIINSIAYGDNLWVAGGYGGQLRTSENVFDQVDVFGDAVTINSSSGLKTRDQWSVATAIKTGEDEWLITGDLSE
jgi:hypothetical protein